MKHTIVKTLVLTLLLFISGPLFADGVDGLRNIPLNLARILLWFFTAIGLIILSTRRLPLQKAIWILPAVIGFIMVFLLVGKFFSDYYFTHDDLLFMDEKYKSFENSVPRKNAWVTIRVFIGVQLGILALLTFYVFSYRKNLRTKT